MKWKDLHKKKKLLLPECIHLQIHCKLIKREKIVEDFVSSAFKSSELGKMSCKMNPFMNPKRMGNKYANERWQRARKIKM